MAKHTAAPWHRNIKAEGKYPIVFSGRNNHVAKILQQENPEETEANISLIAEAPNMYDLLKEVRQHVDRNTNKGRASATVKKIDELMKEIEA